MVACSRISAPDTTQQYILMGCAFQLVAIYDPAASPYDFRELDQPGLTKHGWIKFQVICTLLVNWVRVLCVFDVDELLSHTLNTTQEDTYSILQAYITTFNLQVKNITERALFPGGRYPPLPERSTVEWYAKSLASALGIRGIEEIYQDLQAWIQALQNPESSYRSDDMINNHDEFMEQDHDLAVAQQNMATSHAINLIQMKTLESKF